MTIDPRPVTITVPATYTVWAREALSRALHSGYPWDDDQREGIIAVENALADAADRVFLDQPNDPEPATGG